MPHATRYRRRATARDFRFFADPRLWPVYPFLPLTRRTDDNADFECGLLYDAYGVSGTTGFRSTVFLNNLFTLPPTEAQLLAGPRRSYESFDELADDGWSVD
jgi:hypothetical protein